MLDNHNNDFVVVVHEGRPPTELTVHPYKDELPKVVLNKANCKKLAAHLRAYGHDGTPPRTWLAPQPPHFDMRTYWRTETDLGHSHACACLGGQAVWLLDQEKRRGLQRGVYGGTIAIDAAALLGISYNTARILFSGPVLAIRDPHVMADILDWMCQNDPVDEWRLDLRAGAAVASKYTAVA